MLVPSVLLLTGFISSILAGDHPDGNSKVSRSQDALGNYQFGYTISNVEGEHFRQEGTDTFGRVVGSYGLTNIDGRQRVVDYVADKDGFRARVRSNEPGVENSDTLSSPVERADHARLDTAATSNSEDESFEAYGKRLKPTASRVAYVESDVDDVPRRTRPRRPPTQSSYRPLGAAARDSRQRDLDEYRPSIARPIPPPNSISRPSGYSPGEGPRRRPQSSASPPDVYQPPIDPNTAVRRPTYYIPRDTDTNNEYPTTTSRRPFIPPYGGFENEPLPIDRYPGVSMTNIHGGVEPKTYLPPPVPTRIYGAGRYPSDTPPSQPLVPQRYPNGDSYGLPPPYPGRVVLAPPPQGGAPPDVIYGRPPLSPPPGSNEVSSPNLVLRAVPIPNGIQAVRVDPSSGRVYDRLDYPLYLREEGVPPYDRNVLIHNDDVSDDARDDERRRPGNYDIPIRDPNRPNFRDIRNQPFDNEYGRSRFNNRSYSPPEGNEDQRLSRPSARDLALINRHLSIVNQNRYGPNRQYGGNGSPYGPSDSSRFQEFDDDLEDPNVFRSGPREFNPYAGAIPDSFIFGRPGELQYPGFPRNSRNRRLSQKESKEVAVSTLEGTDSKSNGTVASKVEYAEVEKE